MTDNPTPIGPHGIGCKCPPRDDKGAEMKIFSQYRGDLHNDDKPSRMIYEFLVGAKDSEDKNPAVKLTVDLDLANPIGPEAMVFLEENLGDLMRDAMNRHLAAKDPIGLLLAVLGGLTGGNRE